MLEKKQALLDILLDEIPEESPLQGNIVKLFQRLIARGVTVQQHGRWIPRNPKNPNGWHYCSTCKRDITAIKAMYYKHCPECGTIMDFPRITDITRQAVIRMGASVHGSAADKETVELFYGSSPCTCLPTRKEFRE